jgi:hypothetical protein
VLRRLASSAPLSAATLLAAALAVAVSPGAAHAQPAPASDEEGPTVSNSGVGYIDAAIPGNQLRLRYDAAFYDNRPTRAEFLYPRGGPAGPGPRIPEANVNFQDLSTYLELLVVPRLSCFFEVPVRFVDFDFNPDSSGLSDVNAGFKFAFVDTSDLVATFQLRAYAPTGDAHRGLGTDHTSLEPAFLFYKPLGERLRLEGELRDWIPIGGTDFAGNVVRYGLGFTYDLCRVGKVRVEPVTEFVGWTVLGGKETVVSPSGAASVENAAGDSIFNIKLGARLRFNDRADVYVGYGRPLTGERWYEDIYRVELRLRF